MNRTVVAPADGNRWLRSRTREQAVSSELELISPRPKDQHEGASSAVATPVP